MHIKLIVLIVSRRRSHAIVFSNEFYKVQFWITNVWIFMNICRIIYMSGTCVNAWLSGLMTRPRAYLYVSSINWDKWWLLIIVILTSSFGSGRLWNRDLWLVNRHVPQIKNLSISDLIRGFYTFHNIYISYLLYCNLHLHYITVNTHTHVIYDWSVCFVVITRQ